MLPCPAWPRALDNKGRPAGTHRDKIACTLKPLEAARGEELPQVPLVRTGEVVVRAREDLTIFMRMGEGIPQGVGVRGDILDVVAPGGREALEDEVEVPGCCSGKLSPAEEGVMDCTKAEPSAGHRGGHVSEESGAGGGRGGVAEGELQED